MAWLAKTKPQQNITNKNFLFFNSLIILLLYFTFSLSSVLGIKKTQMRKNKEKKIYNFGKLFAPNSSKKNPTKNTPKQKAMDPLTLNFP